MSETISEQRSGVAVPLFRDTDLGGRLSPFKGVWPRVADGAFVFHGAQLVGDVDVGAGASVWHNCVVRGDVNYVRIGTRSNIQDGTVIHVSTNTFPTVIGRDVLVAHGVLLHGCTLEDYAFVGMGSIVMDDCVVEGDAMLAAGAMLTPGRRIRAGELWAGRPAKFLRPLRDEEVAKNRSMAEHYRRLACQHRLDASGGTAVDPYP